MPRPKSNFKSKGGRRQFKGKKEFSEDRPEVKKTSCNDASWYVREGQLAKDVASYSFNTALGNAVELYVDNSTTAGVHGKRVAVPGIMRIHTVPMLGYSADGSSAINLAAKNLYSWVRHANSGHSNYDSPDLMLYIAAMDNLYAFIWHLQRAYGTARVYSQKNRFIGDALLRAMGFVPDEVRSNLADFRAYINMLIVKASAFCTPTTMSIFKRHTWMYSGVFRDEDVEKSQMYLYVPDVLYMYNENSGAGKLDPVPVIARSVFDGGGGMEAVNSFLNTWYTIGNTMINRLVASEDINIMSGDIRKAFPDQVWQIGLVPEDFVTVPIYSEEILDQIHNTVFTGRYPLAEDPNNPGSFIASYNALTIYQDVLDPLQPIKCTPIFNHSYSSCITHFCDMAENEPTPERVLVATRNMIHGVNDGVNTSVITIDSFGSDLCLYADMYSFSSGGSEQIDRVYDAQYSYVDVEKLTKFNKAPIVYHFDINTFTLDETLGELGDFIIMDYKDINKMHESALLSMLGVPV